MATRSTLRTFSPSDLGDRFTLCRFATQQEVLIRLILVCWLQLKSKRTPSSYVDELTLLISNEIIIQCHLLMILKAQGNTIVPLLWTAFGLKHRLTQPSPFMIISHHESRKQNTIRLRFHQPPRSASAHKGLSSSRTSKSGAICVSGLDLSLINQYIVRPHSTAFPLECLKCDFIHNTSYPNT